MRFEPLEHRHLMAVIPVTSGLDSGAGSLRQAILDANLTAEADDIVFSGDFDSGTLAVKLDSALPVIAADLTITGPEQGITIDAQGNGRPIAIGVGVNVTMSSLTITHGVSSELSTDPDEVLPQFGGGILNLGDLTLLDVTITDCQAVYGGGLYTSNAAHLERVTISNNTAALDSSSSIGTGTGGGIYVFTGSLELRNSRIEGNFAAGAGGGILNLGGNNTVAIEGTTIAANKGNFGGGIYTYLPLTISRSTINNNHAIINGGGILLAFDSVNPTTSTKIYNTTIASNQAASGGGIHASAATDVINSTIADNGATPLLGGGILRNDASASGDFNLTNSIVSFNTGGNVQGTLATNSQNLIFNANNAQALRLGAFGDHGGPTQTYSLLAGSNAIDAGDSTVVSLIGNLDQRGSTRRVDAAGSTQRTIDIGAFEFSPGLDQPFAVGADIGDTPRVKVYNGDGTLRFSFLAYGDAFRGGVRVAVGDVTGDGIQDIITAPGPTGGPHIRVWNGRDGSLFTEYFAYSPAFTGGVFVAAGDLNANGKVEIITAAGAGGGPHVRAFADGVGTVLYTEFYAFDPSFTGGVQVASGDIDGDGKDDIITAAGTGGGSQIRAFSGAQPQVVLRDFAAFSTSVDGAVSVAAGDVDGDGVDDIIVGRGAGLTPDVAVFRSDANLSVLFEQFLAYGVGFSGGVRVAALDVNGDGFAEIITGAGASGGPHVRVRDGLTLHDIDSFFALSETFTGGLFVAA